MAAVAYAPTNCPVGQGEKARPTVQQQVFQRAFDTLNERLAGASDA